MADKLVRTTVVMSFFLILALFSGCGADGKVNPGADDGIQPAEYSVNRGDPYSLEGFRPAELLINTNAK